MIYLYPRDVERSQCGRQRNVKFDSSILFKPLGFNPASRNCRFFPMQKEFRKVFPLLAGITLGRAGQRGFMLSIFLLQH